MCIYLLLAYTGGWINRFATLGCIPKANSFYGTRYQDFHYGVRLVSMSCVYIYACFRERQEEKDKRGLFVKIITFERRRST